MVNFLGRYTHFGIIIIISDNYKIESDKYFF
jgi:hypothetical protein